MLTRVKNYKSDQVGESRGERIGSEYQIFTSSENSQPKDSSRLEETWLRVERGKKRKRLDFVLES